MYQDYSIMVVDDDDDYCFVTEMILQNAGFKNQSIIATDGLEAFKKSCRGLLPSEKSCHQLFSWI